MSAQIGHCTRHEHYQFGCILCSIADADLQRALGKSVRTPNDAKLVTALHGFLLLVEDVSRGSYSDYEAHRALSAIHGEATRMIAVLNRPDLLAEVIPAQAQEDHRG